MATDFKGTDLGLGSIARLSDARSRSISAENFAGRKGAGGMATKGTGAAAARELGRGWKVSPCIDVAGNAAATLADIEGPGQIQHIWITCRPAYWRHLVLRMHWDNEPHPSVEVPLGDLFCNGWNAPCNVNSLPISVNPSGAFNSYWPMPFRRRAQIEIVNLGPEPAEHFFYQIDYALAAVPDDAGYFHAQWRRVNPLPYKEVFTVLDGVSGQGHYAGAYLAWGTNNNGWWGEGEMKFYLDGDRQWPTICGTGTEDYFGGAWGFKGPEGSHAYGTYSTPFLGFHQVIQPDGFNRSQTRFGMYRWHIMDPIRFASDLRVTLQALGWRSPQEGKPRYLPLQDDIAATAVWYQREPHIAFPLLEDRDFLEVI